MRSSRTVVTLSCSLALAGGIALATAMRMHSKPAAPASQGRGDGQGSVRVTAGVRGSGLSPTGGGTGGAATTFVIGGVGHGKLYPGGPAVPVDLIFTNPNAAPIRITSVTVTVSGSSPAGCATAVSVSRQLQSSPVIAAGATSSLDALGLSKSLWPELVMRDGGDAQDACEGATISLSYSGTATG